MAWNPFKKDDWSKVGDKIKGGFKAGTKPVDHAVHEIEKTFEKRIPELVTKELPHALEKVVADIAKDGGKKALKQVAKLARNANTALIKFDKNHPGLTEALDEQTFDIELKAAVSIGISVSGMFTRGKEIAGVLDRYANKGVKPRRRDIVGLVKAIGPSSVSIGAELEWSTIISIGASGSITITGDLIVELLDLILKEAGVPN